MRGSIHCHCVAKLKNDPGLCKLPEKAFKGYLGEKSLDHTESTDLPALNQRILDGKKASEGVCQYVDWFTRMMNLFIIRVTPLNKKQI